MANLVVAVCDTCGKDFERSRYNPYLTSCPACRKALKKAPSLQREVSSLHKTIEDGLSGGSKDDTIVPKPPKPKANPLAVFAHTGPAPRETIICEECGEPFERSVYHTYIVTCKKCRKEASKARKQAKKHSVKCPECRKIIEQPRKLGLSVCPKCKTHWWSMGDSMPNVFINKSSMEDLVYDGGVLIGPFQEVWPKKA